MSIRARNVSAWSRLRHQDYALVGIGGVGPCLLDVGKDHRPRVDAEGAAGDLLGGATMTGLVDRAEKLGLLQRAPNPTDGRAVDVRISPAGTELGDRLYARVARSLSAMTSTLPRADQRRLQALLESMLGRR